MKKILVVSDSHGNVENMVFAVKKEEPDMIIHLGDCWADSQELKEEFPDIPMERVPGNCDMSREPAEKILIIDGVRVLICHGHTYNVKSSYLSLEMAALEKEVDVALFGHTHRVFYDYHNGIRFLNPGSIGSFAWGAPPSYGILTIDGDGETIRTDVAYIE